MEPHQFRRISPLETAGAVSMPAPALAAASFTTEALHDRAVLRVAGELDIATAGDLADRAMDLTTRYTDVEVNLAAVEFIDCVCFELLIDLKQGSLVTPAGSIRLVTGEGAVLDLARSTFCDKHFEIADPSAAA